MSLESAVAAACAHGSSIGSSEVALSSTSLAERLPDSSDPLDCLADSSAFGPLYLRILSARIETLWADDPSETRQVADTYQYGLNAVVLSPDTPPSSLKPSASYLLPKITAFCDAFSLESVLPLLHLLQDVSAFIEAWSFHDTNQSYTLIATLMDRYLSSDLSIPLALTPLHRTFVYVSYKLSEYDLAQKIIEVDFCDIDTRFSKFSFHDHVVYHYYAGLIYIAQRNYSRATKFFNLVVTTPGDATTVLACKAYQKLFLIELISSGMEYTLRFNLPHPVMNAFRNIPSVYTDLASAYSNGDFEKARSTVKENREQLHKDENDDLADIALERINAHAIRKLTKIYSKTSLSYITNRIGLNSQLPDDIQQVRDEIDKLVNSGELHASIEREIDADDRYNGENDATVSFEDMSIGQYQPSTQKDQVDSALNILRTTNSQLDQHNRAIQTSDAFLKKVAVAPTPEEFSHGMGGMNEEEEEGEFDQIER